MKILRQEEEVTKELILENKTNVERLNEYFEKSFNSYVSINEKPVRLICFKDL